MRHRRATKKLSRSTSNRKALLRSLARNLIVNERIFTTYAKAKQASSLVDKLIKLGQRNRVSSKKTAIGILGSKDLIDRLFDEIAPRFAGRKGGYTRVLKLASRKGDGAKMALLELTERRIEKQPLTKKKELKPEVVKKELHRIEKEEEKPIQKEEKPLPTVPPKGAAIPKEKLAEEKSKERVKGEKEKLQRSFFKGLRHYFRRKSF